MIQQISIVQYQNPQHPHLVKNMSHPYYACTSAQLPTLDRNYCIFDKNEVDYFVRQKENALPYLTDILQHSNNEAQVTNLVYHG